MGKYRVVVETPGKLIFFKNRKIRSPFTLEVDGKDLKLLKMTMSSNDIRKFIIEEINKAENVWEKLVTKEETVVEELFDVVEEVEPKTLLEKLLKDEKNGE
jgi:hypothetical protein